ncbi:FliI/YscN family ATPase [Jannaschia seohaensis]|uniref:Flagellum-specific ATP synthase n=1 Tax=Jannaschia seohaensis TaxID=475081 RepID=A0A2Y9AYD2_9RHOB|nr:FliI/YscN family ATPase [Jannaschia seohaensis]PWJ16148.1 flagellum-specific ATP synthase [Jannaschia seohaensis]SSA49136.1 flagellum-specific ATP synthase [Jannaschia seohaensis]
MTIDTLDPFAPIRARLTTIDRSVPVGRIVALDGTGFTVAGLSRVARLGDDIRYRDGAGRVVRAEVVRLDRDGLRATPFGPAEGLALGAEVLAGGPPGLSPSTGWVGRVVDPFGAPLDGRPLPQGQRRPITGAPPAATRRRALGARLSTGVAVLDTMLPLAAGQRVGLFAGSGVGKSSLLGQLARRLQGDVCVLALVGERGREVADFIRDVLGPEGMARTVIVAATADMPAPVRRRAALSAMTVAEFFRDQGARVAFFCDSVTRLAEAHREIALAAGESAELRGHPASLTPLLASLAERAGPGVDDQGDITAVMSVLVAGSDLEEPVADILRGQLDGHVVLSRSIAEAGRFPAVDVLRSVSRSLPRAATPEENSLIAEARRLLGVMERSELMVNSGLYDRGSAPELDRAISLVPRVEEVFTRTDLTSPPQAFALLAQALGRGYAG